MSKHNKMKNKERNNSKSGFTIIEVTLVTAFIAVLLIIIATILASMISLYQKGMTLKTINSAGRNLIAELTASINAAPSIDTTSLCGSLLDNQISINNCVNDNASKFIFQDVENSNYSDNIVDANGQRAQGPVQYAGVFCTGDYSYVWNTKYGRENNNSHAIEIIYNDNNGNEQRIKDFKIARFKDKTYRACSTNVDSTNYDITLSNVINVKEYANHGVMKIANVDTDFLETSVDANNKQNDAEINLDLYELTIFPVSQDAVTLRAFFSGTFILGTERGNATIVRAGDYCDTTNVNSTGEGGGNLQDLGSEFNYCGINKFNFAARTAGSGV